MVINSEQVFINRQAQVKSERRKQLFRQMNETVTKAQQQLQELNDFLTKFKEAVDAAAVLAKTSAENTRRDYNEKMKLIEDIENGVMKV